MYSSIYYWRDIPSYNRKDFVIISGKPYAIEEYDTARGGTDVYLTIDGKTYELYPTPWYKNLEELKNKKFTLYYLPQTNWLVRYEME
ncbi:hypothetical protein [Peribacillus alkalitolerans]|uniref:hypothetical protein n=1 Tax=Peribacillus alkalitolerans TaxID=1550385 RepID=UPI0013D8897A|nr:hypothetical protein [Peribacillus alkalitolerans]